MTEATNEIMPISNESGYLICPKCQELKNDPKCQVHQVSIDVISPGTKKGKVHIDSEGITVNQEDIQKERGVRVVMNFECEFGHSFCYEFQFHKGVTIVSQKLFEDIKCKEDELHNPSVIWRD